MACLCKFFIKRTVYVNLSLKGMFYRSILYPMKMAEDSIRDHPYCAISLDGSSLPPDLFANPNMEIDAVMGNGSLQVHSKAYTTTSQLQNTKLTNEQN
ncbi:hypothetical protein CDAR_238051 [Caerostris darwini]|uniref:Uncharacterized protein n=1 Tax=Caerostris darwini TaxID=1538125 RepID=A0AAV4T330_9ARAC|nr:hypothetical protein CDAR_238051 [Caerostris darwini]